jgi:hypothetical protein
MDPTLAELYGTNQPDETDLEKLAQAELAQELADEGGVDLDNLDGDALEQLAQEVLAEGEQEGDEEAEKTAALEYGDFMGRVMAHAFTNELRGIDKEAKAKELAAGAKAGVKRVGELLAGGKKAFFHRKKGDVEGRAGQHLVAAFRQRKTGPVGKATWREALKSTGTRAATAAGVGAAGYGTKRALSKKASAFETLAEQRAQEILEQSTEQDPYEVLGEAVEQRAAELLAEAGYVVE